MAAENTEVRITKFVRIDEGTYAFTLRSGRKLLGATPGPVLMIYGEDGEPVSASNEFSAIVAEFTAAVQKLEAKERADKLAAALPE